MQKGKHSVKTFMQKESAWKYSSGRELKGCPTEKGPPWELFSKVKLHSNQRSLQSWFKAPWLSLQLTLQAGRMQERSLKFPVEKACLTRPCVADPVPHRKPREVRDALLLKSNLQRALEMAGKCNTCKAKPKACYSIAAMQSTQFFINLESSMEL